MKIKTVAFQFWSLIPLIVAAWVNASAAPIQLAVDATDVSRQVLHARLIIPAQSGKLTLVYPKWLPGHHSPEGPIADLTGLKFSANGKSLNWRRDADDMYAFHLDVPTGASTVEASLDCLLPPPGSPGQVSATANLMILTWHLVVLYPGGSNANDVQFVASLKLPADWRCGTALPVASESGSQVQFAPVSLETLVDSPVLAGRHFRTFDLAPGAKPAYRLHVAADSAGALEMKSEDHRHFERLVTEANALFGAHHFGNYHFLLALSDHISHFGLEHHESSDNRRVEKFLTDPDARKLGGGLLPHELAHSWNGKYRRPAGLATPDFQQPMQGELLWVYEGLTTYLGDVLTVRCGLWTNADYLEDLALDAATLDVEPGRSWRPLSDTTIAAQLLYGARGDGAAWRRKVDFYPEGALIWLEVDTIIRQGSRGQKSLDDFCKAFFGGKSGPPTVVPYTLDDVVSALNQVHGYNWREFFEQRVYAINARAPLKGIENAGWQLAYTNTVPAMLKTRETARKFTSLIFSLGLTVGENGNVRDVLRGSAADKAGVSPNMKLLAVNGRRWTPATLRAAVSEAKTNRAPIELLLEQDDYFITCKVEYHDGEKYPYLERDAAQPDLLGAILESRVPPAGRN